jgi:hypothetical protein
MRARLILGPVLGLASLILAGCLEGPPDDEKADQTLIVSTPDDPNPPQNLPPPPPPVACRGGEPGSTWTFTNLNNETRYVKTSDGYVKLFMNQDAHDRNEPWQGFRDGNDFQDSCAPTAGMNLFDWYGADDRSLQCEEDYWFGGRFFPGRCWKQLDVFAMGRTMQTNEWTPGASYFEQILFPLSAVLEFLSLAGTSTPHFVDGMNHYSGFYMTSRWQLQYWNLGSPRDLHDELWNVLNSGHPIVIPYKTLGGGGHFATIVGMERCGSPGTIDHDLVYLANPVDATDGHAMAWWRFQQLWRRDYAGPDAVLEHYGEYAYSRVYFQ